MQWDHRPVLAVVMAGGEGTRLFPLTRDRAKPAVPFGGAYRIIDFTLSNCINSELRHVLVMTQYKSDSLNRHIHEGWNFLSSELHEFVRVVPPQQRIHSEWYRGTADCIHQNLHMIRYLDPGLILVLSGDHIYHMDYQPLIERHRQSGAELTIAAIPVALAEASRFGVIDSDAAGRVTGFQEKPADPRAMPGDPSRALASMGIYVFSADTLYRQLDDGPGRNRRFDFGRDIVPHMLEQGANIGVYRFGADSRFERNYWRDVGTVESYYEANMDLISVTPQLNLYDVSWPVRTMHVDRPPAKFVFAQEYPGGRCGKAVDSLVSPGCIISGGSVARSILSPNVRVNSWAEVQDSILMEGVEVGRFTRIRRAIVDKFVKIPPRMTIGFNRHADAELFHVTESGIVVIPKNESINVTRGSLVRA